LCSKENDDKKTILENLTEKEYDDVKAENKENDGTQIIKNKDVKDLSKNNDVIKQTNKI